MPTRRTHWMRAHGLTQQHLPAARIRTGVILATQGAHHFQVVDVGRGRCAGPMRDTVIVPPGGLVTVALDLDKAGSGSCTAITFTSWQPA